jgi:hypothetical protein
MLIYLRRSDLAAQAVIVEGHFWIGRTPEVTLGLFACHGCISLLRDRGVAVQE